MPDFAGLDLVHVLVVAGLTGLGLLRVAEVQVVLALATRGDLVVAYDGRVS